MVGPKLIALSALTLIALIGALVSRTVTQETPEEIARQIGSAELPKVDPIQSSGEQGENISATEAVPESSPDADVTVAGQDTLGENGIEVKAAENPVIVQNLQHTAARQLRTEAQPTENFRENVQPPAKVASDEKKAEKTSTPSSEKEKRKDSAAAPAVNNPPPPPAPAAVHKGVHDRPILAAYWETWGAHVLPLENVPAFVDLVLIAFVKVINGLPEKQIPGDQDAIRRGIEKIHSYGNKVILSIGGAGNCDNTPAMLFGDQMFSREGLSERFADEVVALVQKYNLDGIDMDYECINPDNNQNIGNAAATTAAIRRKLPPGKEISWAAFANIGEYGGYVNQTPLMHAVKQHVDLVMWMSYNVHDNADYTNQWYGDAISRFNNIVAPVFGHDCKKVLFGHCSGSGCAHGAGPKYHNVMAWAKHAKANNCGGIFVWDLQKEKQMHPDLNKSTLSDIAAIFRS